MKTNLRRHRALLTTLAYATGGAAWILLSDRMLSRAFDHDTYVLLSSYKGLGFIAVTSVLLFVALGRRAHSGDPAAQGEHAHSGGGIILGAAAIASVLIVASAALGYRTVAGSMADNALDEARAIVKLKSDDLGRWLEAQQSAAAHLAASGQARSAADRIELRGGNREALRQELARLGSGLGFAAVDLVDATGRSLLRPGDAPAPAVRAAASRSLESELPALVDLHSVSGSPAPRFGFVVPLPARPDGEGGRIAIHAELDARDHLYPFVRLWPLRNATGSGVLGRREGDDVLILTGLPGDDQAAMRLRLPYATSQVPLARFLRGEADAVRGVDPNGVAVFAAGRKVPGTEWELVARINEAEALNGLQGVARLAGLLAAIGVAATWLIAGFLWQNQTLARTRARQMAERRFRVGFEQAAVGMAHVDLKGRYLRVNRKLCELYGFSQEEMIGADSFGISSPEHHATMVSQLAAFKSGETREFFGERKRIRKDGSVVDVALSIVLVPGEGREEPYLSVVNEDISRRKAAEEALRISEERFRLAMEGSNEGLWDWRPETGETYYSPRWKAMLGYADEEIEPDQSAWRRVTEPGARDVVRKQFHEILAGQRATFEFETRMRHKDGHWLDIFTRGLPVVDKGRMIRVVGTDVDVTLRKSHEADLRLAATVYSSTHEGVVVTDRDRKIVMVNPAFETITGYGEEEMRGQTMRKIQSGRHGRDFYQAMWQAVAEAGYWRGEIWNRRKNGEIYPEWLTISAVRDGGGEVSHYVGLFSDIGRLKQTETRLDFLAHHDPLTKLPNRLMLRLRVEHAIERSRRTGTVGAVLFLDLDRFKTVNDSLGHATGDQLLVEVAERWKARLRGSDTLARLGGDEFVVLLEDVGGAEAAALVAQALIEETAAPFALPNYREACVGVSVGVGLFPGNGGDAEELIQHADSALYLAKQAGGGTVRFYTDDLTTAANARLELEARMRRGLERGEFALQFQPLVRLDGRSVVGVEALARWNSPTGLVPPDEFIPLAEATGLIIPLGEWVLREACARLKAWRDRGVGVDMVAVNLSPLQLERADICQRIKAILEETGLPPECLEIEITESALMEQGGGAEAKLTAMKALGLHIAIDDFGAGHSSLFYLKRFPIDKLKLDRSFIADIPNDPTSMEIAAAIVRLAHSLKVTALAEGVETEAQADFLAACGCTLAQGYLFYRPMWEKDLLARLAAPEARAQAQAQAV